MKIFIVCSKSFYTKVEPIKQELEKKGHTIIVPNLYEERTKEVEPESTAWNFGQTEHIKFKKNMYKMSREKIKNVDALLVLNFDKKNKKNYIGGATFLEMYNSFLENKKIYLFNDIPHGDLYDEIHGFEPTIINGNLDLIK
jgi:hypothetical protein